MRGGIALVVRRGFGQAGVRLRALGGSLVGRSLREGWAAALSRSSPHHARPAISKMGARGMGDESPQMVKGTKTQVAMESIKTGLIAGTFGSMVGVGGGVIMVPMMTCEPMCMQARHASATSLVAVLGTGVVSAVLYGLQGQVDLVGAAILASASVLSAPAGARMTMKINNTRLKTLMGLFLMLLAPAVPLKEAFLMKSADTSTDAAKELQAPEAAAGEGEASGGIFQAAKGLIEKSPGFMALPSDQQPVYAASLVVTGGLAGFLSGLLGIGGGMIVTPVLALMSGMPQAAVVGTSMVAMVFPSARGLYTHHTLGNVRWRVGRLLLVGSATGAVGGVALGNAAGDSGMKYAFAVGMFFLGSKTFMAGISK